MDKFSEKYGKICLRLDDYYSLRISEKYDFSNVELLLRFGDVFFLFFGSAIE